VKARSGYDHNEIKKNIKKYTGLAAYSSKEASDITLNYWMKSTGIPINFGISVFLGFIVGAAIVGQTFFNFISENIKQYASLKAMGLKNSVLTKMVILQASVVGFVGYGIGVAFTTIFGIQIYDSVLAFKMSPGILLFAGCGVLLIVILSALIAIRKVIKVDPAIVFRG
jgi:putative ABC transport system permease protein